MSNLLLKAGLALITNPTLRLDQVTCNTLSFEHLQEWRLHTISGQTIHCLITLTLNRFLQKSNWNSPLLHLLLSVPHSSLCNSKKCVALSSLYPPITDLKTAIRIPFNLLFQRLNKLILSTSFDKQNCFINN